MALCGCPNLRPFPVAETEERLDDINPPIRLLMEGTANKTESGSRTAGPEDTSEQALEPRAAFAPTRGEWVDGPGS